MFSSEVSKYPLQLASKNVVAISWKALGLVSRSYFCISQTIFPSSHNVFLVIDANVGDW